MAQREGFEPSDTFLHHTISNRARSTAPPSLHHCYYILSNKKNQLFLRRFSKVFLSIFRIPALVKKICSGNLPAFVHRSPAPFILSRASFPIRFFGQSVFLFPLKNQRRTKFSRAASYRVLRFSLCHDSTRRFRQPFQTRPLRHASRPAFYF